MADKSKPPMCRKTSAANREAYRFPRREFDAFRCGPRRNVFVVSSVAFFVRSRGSGAVSRRAYLSSAQSAARTIDIFVSALPKFSTLSKFSLSRENGHTWWLFFGRALWPSVNLWNLCQRVSFGSLESSRRDVTFDCLWRSPSTFAAREIFNVRFSNSIG